MSTPTVIESPTRKYTVKSTLGSGDLCDIYRCVYANGGGDTDVIVKVTHDGRDNDLTTNEAAILGILRPQDEPADSKLKLYVPKLIDSFVSPAGMRVNVLAPDGGQEHEPHVSLEDVIRAYPKGVHFRDMVWMYKRLLVAIGVAHSKGIIHGAVLPPHVLVHPTGHGAKLIDWSYALNFAALVKPKPADPKAPAAKPHKATNAWEKLLDGPEYDPDPLVRFTAPTVTTDPNAMYVRALSVPYESFYAPEVLTKKTPTPATDLYMAAKTIVVLLGGDVETNQIPYVEAHYDVDATDPQRGRKQRDSLQSFLSLSLLQDARKRPWDAWDLHESFDRLILSLCGKPTYRPFSMPAAN